ncbi:MAG: four helix bundle protein [Prevotella sp.]|nr:four helix bundle protein [Prevotella sp.]
MTNTSPKSEIYGLTSQIRTSAESIPPNIAEGYGRTTNTDLAHFPYMASGSSNEPDTQMVTAMNDGNITQEQ